MADPILDKADYAAGIVTALNGLKNYNFTVGDILPIFGFDACAATDFQGLKKSLIELKDSGVKERADLISDITSRLDQLADNPVTARTLLESPQDWLDKQTPKSLMKSGKLEDLIRVAHFLEQMPG